MFYSALILAFLVLVGPIPHIAVRLFWVHMVQHILLMMLISPLLVLGSPIALALGSKNLMFRSAVRGLTQNRLVRKLFIPQVGFLIFLTTLVATHFSPLANAGMVPGQAREHVIVGVIHSARLSWRSPCHRFRTW